MTKRQVNPNEKMVAARYLKRISLVSERVPTFSDFPYSLPFVRGLDLRFKNAVTYFVGENGSGKSTVLEAIAELCDLPVSGGGRNELADRSGPEQRSALGSVIRASFAPRPRDGYFFRSEFQAHFASLLDQRRDDPDFKGNPYSRYGGRSLHTRSHGEAFLAVILNRMDAGLFLMDEPESALSPQRQLAPRSVGLAETSQYQITRGILENPERYWRLLTSDDPDSE